MEVIIIGSGTGVPRLRRGSPAVGVKAGDTFILLDIGSGTLRAMLRYDLNLNDIDILCLSHWHPDHVADLVPFFFASRYGLGYTRKEPFWLLAAQGFSEFQGKLQSVWGEWVEPPEGLIRLQEMTTDRRDTFTVNDLTITTAPVNHIASSLAYRLEYAGRSMVYSGDTDWSDSLIDLASGTDLLILEASNPFKVPGHLTPEEAGRLAWEADVPRLVLDHIYPTGDAVDLGTEAGRSFSGQIIIAEDGLRLQV
jgi:ribonuclease BN (tRNA processing enzyme)